MPLRWYTGPDHEVPRQINCVIVAAGYPDVHGRPQSNDTHFDTEDEAWIAGRRRVQIQSAVAQELLRLAQERLAQAQEAVQASAEANERFERAQAARSQVVEGS